MRLFRFLICPVKYTFIKIEFDDYDSIIRCNTAVVAMMQIRLEHALCKVYWMQAFFYSKKFFLNFKISINTHV